MMRQKHRIGAVVALARGVGLGGAEGCSSDPEVSFEGTGGSGNGASTGTSAGGAGGAGLGGAGDCQG